MWTPKQPKGIPPEGQRRYHPSVETFRGKADSARFLTTDPLAEPRNAVGRERDGFGAELAVMGDLCRVFDESGHTKPTTLTEGTSLHPPTGVRGPTREPASTHSCRW